MAAALVFYSFTVKDGQETRTHRFSIPSKTVNIVYDLVTAIWGKEQHCFKECRGVYSEAHLSLWKKEDGKTLELDRVLFGGDDSDPVFKDREDKEVSVTPVGAKNWDDAFVVRGTPVGSFTYAAGTSGAVVRDESKALAKALLQSFSLEKLKNLEDVREALKTVPVQKIPLRQTFFDMVKNCDLASDMFKLETPECRADVISNAFEAAVRVCMLPAYADPSSNNRLAYWDSIFCKLWDALLDEAGIGSIYYYSRNSGSHSGASVAGSRSDCSLLVYGKEVFYGEEDSGSNPDAAVQLKKKLKGVLDPTYFAGMSHMICYATKDTTLRILAIPGSKSGVPTDVVLDTVVIRNAQGLLKSLMLSINILRIALTWEPEFAKTPARKVKEEKVFRRVVTYGPGINRSVDFFATGVMKTVHPWAKHVAAGYTKNEYVKKAFNALETYAKALLLEDNKYELFIADCGEQRMPQNVQELKECLNHVLTSLWKLHQVNIVHRDVRWDNIVYVVSSSTWLLIDYETVWEANAKPQCELKVFALKDVLEGDGTFSKKSDLKLVGKLLDEVAFSLEDLSDFRGKLLAGYFMDAAAALAGLPGRVRHSIQN